MSFPCYPKYRDSGVEWLGEVPEHWEVAKFRHQFHESAERIEAAVVGPMLSVSGYRGIEVKEYDDENRRRSSEDLVGYRIVRVGQLVVNTMWLNYGGLGVSPYEGHVSPAYRAYDFSGALSRRYGHYLMRSATYVKGYTRLLTGVRPNSLQMSRDDLMDFPVLVPPQEDQDAVVAFLDRETAKIDALVAEQERLIELLKEKRQATIAHAITKGLNPGAPMKDSGIEWLGEVPAHWEVTRLKRVAEVFPSNVDKKTIEGQPSVVLCNYTDVYYNDEITDYITFMEASATPEQIARFTVRAGDTVITKDSETADDIAVSAFVPKDLPGVLYGYHLAIVRPHHGVNGRFLKRFFDSKFTKSGVAIRANGLTRVGLTQYALDNLEICLPPAEEQSAIAEYVYARTDEMDALASDVQALISTLRERRSALISAAVTGQIDVRHLATAEAA